MSLIFNKKQQEEAEKRFQSEKTKSLIEWEITNNAIVQPILQNSINALVANLVIVKATNEQINNLKQVLNNN